MSEETKQCLIISVCLLLFLVSIPVSCTVNIRADKMVEMEAIKAGLSQRYEPSVRGVIWVRPGEENQ